MESTSFGKLSGELRNQIYEMVLQEGDDARNSIDLEQGWFDAPFHRGRGKDDDWSESAEPSQPLRFNGLPCTCQALRKETLRMWFSMNRFSFETQYLTSMHKDRIVERFKRWALRVGFEQAQEIRDVTISLGTLKGTMFPTKMDWENIRSIRRLFHPNALVKINFTVEGNQTASFVLGSRPEMLDQLAQMVQVWKQNFRTGGKFDIMSALVLAANNRVGVERFLKDMPEEGV